MSAYGVGVEALRVWQWGQRANVQRVLLLPAIGTSCGRTGSASPHEKHPAECIVPAAESDAANGLFVSPRSPHGPSSSQSPA